MESTERKAMSMESKYECPYCGKTKFTSQPGLTNHMKSCSKKDRSPKVRSKSEDSTKKLITDVDLSKARALDKIDFDLMYNKIRRQYLYDVNNAKPSRFVVVHFDYEEAKALMAYFEKMK